MSDSTDTPNGDQPESTDLEQRISALEKQNRKLEAQLNQPQDPGSPNLTRRKALAGLIGGGTLLGAAGSASAHHTEDGGAQNSPFADEVHDHSGDFLGESEPVESIVAQRIHSREVPHADVTAYGATGDGETDDTAAIQAAIDACPVDGTVWFPPGTYNITSQLDAQTDGITLRGPAAIVADSGIDDPMLRVGGEGAVVEDLEFDGNDQARIGLWFEGNGKQTAQQCTARNISHDTSHIYGFGCAADDVTFRDCRAIDVTTTHDLNARGFHGGSTSARMTVDNCYVSNVDSADDADGVRLKKPDSVVTDTYLEECGKRAIKVDGLAQHARVENNVCVWASGGPRRAGIQLQHDDEVATGNYVEADDFASGAGILDHYSDGGTISDNHVVMRDGGRVSDCIETSGNTTIADNTLDVAGGRAGIRLQQTAGGNSISGNAITGSSGAGISLRSTYNDSPTTVSITGGTIRGVDEGVTVQDGTDIVITGVAFDTNETAISDPNSAATVGTNVYADDADDDDETVSVQNQSLDFDGSVDELDGVDSVSVDEDFEVFRGDRELGGDVWITYDESALYLAAAIDDAQHSQDNDPDELYRGDSIQFAVAEGDPDADDTYPEMTIGLTDEGPQVYRYVFSDGSIVDGGLFDAATAAITRDDGAERTVYEIGFPWDGLDIDPSGGTLGVAATIADYDGDDETALFEWGGGIFGSKDPSAFNPADLEE